MDGRRDVAAIVWTYGRPEIAARCVGALRAQTVPVDRIVLVDSASPAEEFARLQDVLGDQVELLRLDENDGPGAAVHLGLERLASRPPRWVWFVEDDSVPSPGCLQELLLAATSAGGQLMVGPDGAEIWRGQWRPTPRLANGASRVVDFVYLDGALAAYDVVRRTGAPRSDFFMMLVDVEYPIRLARDGTPMMQVGVQYVAERLGSQAASTEWRAYYQTRNHLRMVLDLRSPALLGGFVLRTAKHTIVAVRQLNGAEIRLRCRAVVDALRNRMGRTLEPGGTLG